MNVRGKYKEGGDGKDLVTSREKINELKAKVKKLVSKERYSEALAVLHEIDDIEAHVSVITNRMLNNKCMTEMRVPRGLVLSN